MIKTVPIIITNSNILLFDKISEEFKSFVPPGLDIEPNIPFYHFFAKKIAQNQHYFRDFFKKYYPHKYSKYVLAIIVPDDTSALESIFINEFFLNSGTCRGVAQITMSQTLSKKIKSYVSVSKSVRNVVLTYVKNNEIEAKKYYDINIYNSKQIMDDAKRLHIDIEYESAPVFVNNFSLDMDDFFDMGIVVTPKQFLDKIAVVDVEKV